MWSAAPGQDKSWLVQSITKTRRDPKAQERYLTRTQQSLLWCAFLVTHSWGHGGTISGLAHKNCHDFPQKRCSELIKRVLSPHEKTHEGPRQLVAGAQKRAPLIGSSRAMTRDILRGELKERYEKILCVVTSGII